MTTAAAATPFTFPDLLSGLDHLDPVVQLAAVRPHIVVVTGALGLVAAAVAGLRRRWSAVGAGLLAVSLLAAATIAPRTIADAAVDAGPGRVLTVLTFNTFGGRADVATLAGLIEQQRPDLVSLPEAGEPYRAQLAPLVKRMGYRLWSSTPAEVGDADGVTALAGPRVGRVRARVDRQTERPSVELSGGELGELRFVAFHSAAPVDGKTARWRSDLSRLPYWCTGSTPAIVAGDFNATLDHSALRTAIRGCADAASALGQGLVPTWTWSHSLRYFAIQIDHVLLTPEIRAESFTVLDLPGSDHRAILTRLRLAPAPEQPPQR